jgi:hypothetical protein
VRLEQPPKAGNLPDSGLIEDRTTMPEPLSASNIVQGPARQLSSSRCRIPSYRLHKATGKAVVTLNGRDIYLGSFGTAQSREYNRIIAEWLANHRQLRPLCAGVSKGRGAGGANAPHTTDGLLIVQLVAQYFPHVTAYYRKNGKPTSEVNIVRNALQPLLDLYGHTLAGDFGPMALKALRTSMSSRGWCRKYVNDQVSRVKMLFRWAVENELIPASVHYGLSAVRGLRRGRSEARESSPVRPVADYLVDAVKPHVSRQIWAMVELQRITGMRSGEVTIMRGCDLDTSGRVWVYTPATHKTEHQRTSVVAAVLAADASNFSSHPMRAGR